MTQESLPVLDNLGQAMVADPDLNVQINGMEQPAAGYMPTEGTGDATNNGSTGGGVVNEEQVKLKVEKMKTYLVNKFHVNVDRIVTGVNTKIKTKAANLQNSKAGQKIKGFLTEFVKL